MKNIISALFMLFLPFGVMSQTFSKVGEAYSSTSINTTIFRNNSIVSDKKFQYISFYDDDAYLVLGKRKIGSDNWTLERTQYKGNVRDAHNVISMMVDGDGFLHVSFDHHGNKLNYCKSIEPGSLKLGELLPMVGNDEDDVTYPEFYTLRNGDILFAYRSGSSGRGNLVLNRYDNANKSWLRVQNVLIDGENQRNAYWQLYVDQNGAIHLSWVWRETWMVETNHDLCYARSYDGGETWLKADGNKYDLPIRKDNAEYACLIPQNSELINQTSMCTDNEGNPYIATYWRDSDSDVPQYRIVWHDGKSWMNARVSDRTEPFSLKGGGTKMIPISRPRMAVDKGKVYYIFRDSERDSKVSIAVCNDIRKPDWKIRDITDFSVNAWEPSYDTELWKNEKKLHIFVQDTRQGDGEKSIQTPPSMVYVLQLEGKDLRK